MDSSIGGKTGVDYQDVVEYMNKCLFVPLQIGFAVDRSTNTDLPYCNHNGRCVTTSEIRSEIAQFGRFWDEIVPVVDKKVLAKAEKQKDLVNIAQNIHVGGIAGQNIVGTVEGTYNTGNVNAVNNKGGNTRSNQILWY